ncbi:MAG: hypothetical protein H5T64_07780 [Chloroflexi bacterium]|nr:hypothetical protein [Chloroflexota bacterium]
MKKALLLIFILVLMACARTHPAPTATPQPTSTATSTPMPPSASDLEPLLVQAGDLPPGLSGSQVSDIIPEPFDQVSPPISVICQQFERNGRNAGRVVVLLYESESKAKEVYEWWTIRPGDGRPNMLKETRVGEQAAWDCPEKYWITQYCRIAFLRCHMVVDIFILGGEEGGRMVFAKQDELLAYAKRLDNRLRPIVCW